MVAGRSRKARTGLAQRDFEKGRHVPIAATLEAMRRAIEAGGVCLIFSEDGTPEGISVKRSDAAA
jgi:hypothetical protein